MKKLFYITYIIFLIPGTRAAFSQSTAETDSAKKAELDQALRQGWTNEGKGMFKEAIPYYQTAAAMGSDYGLRGLANCYFNLNDWFRAIGYYQALAEKGDANAMSQLAYIYLSGKNGVNKDVDKAIELYQKAIASGYRDAMNFLGDMYQNGNGVPRDYAKAMQLYKDAAADGSAPDHIPSTSAMEAVGLMYESGLGVKKDNNAALTWYKRALNEAQVQIHGLHYYDSNQRENIMTINISPDWIQKITAKIQQLENPPPAPATARQAPKHKKVGQ